MPLISVVVTACNNAELLSRCLEALSRSTNQDFELIVVDDASKDGTVDVARRFTDKVIAFESHRGVNEARTVGYTTARGELIVNLDADVLVFPDTLDKIRSVFALCPEADAVTGMLSKKHPFQNFSSQYKNLYMHYIFNQLPRRVTFLYGSLFIFRREIAKEHISDIRYGGDTLFGQQLWLKGKTIYLDKSIEVEHVKHYDLRKLIRNDFDVPFYWSCIFLRYRGIRQVGKNGVGFAHASLRQLMGLSSSVMIMLLMFMEILGMTVFPYLVACLIIWSLLNGGFWGFLFREKGLWFATRSIIFTFLDQIVMLSGIISGLIYFSLRQPRGNSSQKSH
ncbi:MAG: glycosyltransferase family 2 protein [Candidatus Omnitrophica bacterium]|nr:glycosyltransferase family 2 protein [Candidatus Omnitrophota bacterium]